MGRRDILLNKTLRAFVEANYDEADNATRRWCYCRSPEQSHTSICTLGGR